MNVRDAIGNDLVERDGVYYLFDHKRFAYSDGDQAEAFLVRALRDARDLSSNSRELEARAKDWVSRYHLSRSRSLAYQSLQIPSDASVLEVGSGSGAITRMLGERAEWVLAIEGSPRRASMTKLRTRGQSNVSVLCANFERIQFKRRFDIVVCNGVLEYASLFTPGENAAGKMLDMLSRLLAPCGALLVAIENKFGLRYFNSAREEHTNIAFDGLEGYARHQRGPETFGRIELEALLKTHFGSVEFLFPLPDYKFPKAIIRGCLLQETDCSELFSSLGNGPSGTEFRPFMHERLVWHGLGANGLLADTANSFFVVAGATSSSLLAPSWRGDIYAINRSPGQEIRTQICMELDGSIVTKKHYMQKPRNLSPPFQHRLEIAAWAKGESVHTAISRQMLSKSDVSLEERLRPFLESWWSAVVARAGLRDAGLGGDALDLNWENSMLDDGEVRFIDCEWAMYGYLPASWFLYRVVSKFLDTEWNYRHRWDVQLRNISKRRFLIATCSVLGIQITIPSLLQAISQEGRFQRVAVGPSRPAWRVLLEDCAPFAAAYFWRGWTNRLSRLRRKAARNLRRFAEALRS